MPDPASLYPQPPAQNTGLLQGDPTKIIGVIGELNRNALFQQEFAARKAIGQAYRNAITPDGGIDTNVLMKGIKDNPDADFMAGEASAGALARTHAQISNVAAAHDLAAKQQDYVTNFIGSTATNPNATKNDVVNGLVALKRNIPTLPSEMIAGFIRQFNGINDRTPEGQAQLQAAKNMVRDWAMGPTSLAGRVSGPPEPGTGAATTVPLGTANSGTPAPAPGRGAPRMPGQVTTGNPLGAEAAATATGSESGQMLAHHYAQSAEYNRQIFPLETAISALEHLGPTGTGPGTETVNHIKSFLLSMGVPGVDASKIKNFDEAKKYLTDFVNQTGNSGTNDKLAAAFAGNPSVNISNEAAVQVTKSALALRRMQEARIRAFDATGLPEKDFAKFSSRFNSKTDPRVYGFDLMTPDQRKAVVNGITSDTKRSQFMMDVEDAEKAGLLRPPALLPPPADKKK